MLDSLSVALPPQPPPPPFRRKFGSHLLLQMGQWATGKSRGHGPPQFLAPPPSRPRAGTGLAPAHVPPVRRGVGPRHHMGGGIGGSRCRRQAPILWPPVLLGDLGRLARRGRSRSPRSRHLIGPALAAVGTMSAASVFSPLVRVARGLPRECVVARGTAAATAATAARATIGTAAGALQPLKRQSKKWAGQLVCIGGGRNPPTPYPRIFKLHMEDRTSGGPNSGAWRRSPPVKASSSSRRAGAAGFASADARWVHPLRPRWPRLPS